MKRLTLILVLGLFFIGAAQAQTQWYKATEFAIKFKGYEWSDWQPVSIAIEFDLDEDFITIYSNETQIYKITGTLTPPYDSGGKQVKFRIIDQDFDTGNLRLRIENNGNSQIYIDFSDVSWVYNVVRTQ